MTITMFDEPQRYSLRTYSDDCHTLHGQREVYAGTDRCNQFMGSMYATFDIQMRSATCEGSKCSTLSVAVQTFYNAASCTGSEYASFKYPVQGECMRAMNGTQTILASPDDSNITLSDYVNNDVCGRSGSVGIRRTYFIKNALCYPLYTTQAPYSFNWKIERYKAFVAFAPRSSSSLVFSLLALRLFLQRLLIND